VCRAVLYQGQVWITYKASLLTTPAHSYGCCANPISCIDQRSFGCRPLPPAAEVLCPHYCLIYVLIARVVNRLCRYGLVITLLVYIIIYNYMCNIGQPLCHHRSDISQLCSTDSSSLVCLMLSDRVLVMSCSFLLQFCQATVFWSVSLPLSIGQSQHDDFPRCDVDVTCQNKVFFDRDSYKWAGVCMRASMHACVCVPVCACEMFKLIVNTIQIL